MLQVLEETKTAPEVQAQEQKSNREKLDKAISIVLDAIINDPALPNVSLSEKLATLETLARLTSLSLQV